MFAQSTNTEEIPEASETNVDLDYEDNEDGGKLGRLFFTVTTTLIMLIMMGGMLMLIIVIDMAMLVMSRVIQLASSTSRSFAGGVLNALLMNFGFCA